MDRITRITTIAKNATDFMEIMSVVLCYLHEDLRLGLNNGYSWIVETLGGNLNEDYLGIILEYMCECDLITNDNAKET